MFLIIYNLYCLAKFFWSFWKDSVSLYQVKHFSGNSFEKDNWNSAEGIIASLPTSCKSSPLALECSYVGPFPPSLSSLVLVKNSFMGSQWENQHVHSKPCWLFHPLTNNRHCARWHWKIIQGIEGSGRKSSPVSQVRLCTPGEGRAEILSAHKHSFGEPLGKEGGHCTEQGP